MRKDDDALYAIMDFLRADRTQMNLLKKLEDSESKYKDQQVSITEKKSTGNLAHGSLVKIRNIIVDRHPNSVKMWGQIKDSLITRALDTYEIDKELNNDTSKAILMTLSRWSSQSEAGKATLDDLITILRDFLCIGLCDELEDKKEEILSARK